MQPLSPEQALTCLGRVMTTRAEGLPFGEWLDALDIRHFSESEIVTPHRTHIAHSLGHSEFIPNREDWPRFAVVLRLADLVRHAVGSPVRMRNAYRPADYNARVGGAKHSDHIHACGVDLDLRSSLDRATGEAVLRGLDSAIPGLEMSVGLGARTLHVGALSPRGRRQWYYQGYSSPRRSWRAL